MAHPLNDMTDRKIPNLDELHERLKALGERAPGEEMTAEIMETAKELQQACAFLKAETEELQKQAKLDIYHTIFENSFGSNAVMEKVHSNGGDQWVFKAANQRIAGFFGRQVAELPGMPVTDVLGASQGVLDALAAADRACTDCTPTELTGLLEETGWNFHARLVPLGDNQVAFLGMDISPRLKLEEEMRVFEALAENIPEGVAVADAGREIVSMVSQYGRKQVGLVNNLMVDLPFSEIEEVWHLYHPETGAPASLEELPLLRSIRNGEVVKNEEWLLDAEDGSLITISVHTVPVRDKNGSITGAVAAWQDVTERKRQSAEREKLMEQLQAEEKKSAALAAEAREKADELETIFNAIMDPVILFREGRAVRLNPAAEQVLGADQNNSTQKAMRKQFPSRDMTGKPIPEADLPSSRAARGEVVRDQWVRFTDQNGDEHTVISNAIPLYRNGAIDGTVAIWRDVTEREALQASLDQERSRLQAILEFAPDAIGVVDLDGRVLYRNPVGERLRRNPALPYDEGEDYEAPVICRPDGTIFPENDYPMFVSIRTGKNVVNQEMMYRWSDGNTRSVLVSTAPIRSASGEITGGVAIYQDMTPIKEMERELRNSREMYRLMGESLPYGVWYSDADGKAEYVSPSFLELIGMSLDQVREGGWPERLPEAEREKAAAEWVRALETGDMIEHELHIPRKDGTIVSVLSRGLPLKDEDGNIRAWAGINLDVTDRNAIATAANQRAGKIQLQHQLIYQREQERLKIAQELHDGPIQQLYGMVYTLRALEEDMAGRKALFDLRTVEESLQGMARDLRQFCNELRPPSLGSFGLRSAIQSMADTLAIRFPELKITLDMDEEGKNLSPEVRLGLFRVCQELLSNAARHSRGRRLDISLKNTDDILTLIVKDDGHGFDVPADWMDLAREGHLGLVGVQERVDALGGNLEITSADGKGTTVKITVVNPPRMEQPVRWQSGEGD